MRYTAILVLMVAAGPVLASDVADVQISQKDRRFTPSEITVHPDSKIVFLNDDRFTHHIFYDNELGSFDSGAQSPGKSVSMTMDKPGTYEVECAIHPKMRLKVHVSED